MFVPDSEDAPGLADDEVATDRLLVEVSITGQMVVEIAMTEVRVASDGVGQSVTLAGQLVMVASEVEYTVDTWTAGM